MLEPQVGLAVSLFAPMEIHSQGERGKERQIDTDERTQQANNIDTRSSSNTDRDYQVEFLLEFTRDRLTPKT